MTHPTTLREACVQIRAARTIKFITIPTRLWLFHFTDEKTEVLKVKCWLNTTEPGRDELLRSSPLSASLHCKVWERSAFPGLSRKLSCYCIHIPPFLRGLVICVFSVSWLPFPHFLYSRSRSEPSVSALLAASWYSPLSVAFPRQSPGGQDI